MKLKAKTTTAMVNTIGGIGALPAKLFFQRRYENAPGVQACPERCSSSDRRTRATNGSNRGCRFQPIRLSLGSLLSPYYVSLLAECRATGAWLTSVGSRNLRLEIVKLLTSGACKNRWPAPIGHHRSDLHRAASYKLSSPGLGVDRAEPRTVGGKRYGVEESGQIPSCTVRLRRPELMPPAVLPRTGVREPGPTG